MHAPKKTPPAKQEQKLMNILHLILEDTSVLSLNWEKILSGSMPHKKVMEVIIRREITFSVPRPIASIAARPSIAVIMEGKVSFTSLFMFLSHFS